MRRVMFPVPSIKREKLLDRPLSRIGMNQSSLKILFRKRIQHRRPTQMNSLQNIERNLNRQFVIGRSRPNIFKIRSNRRIFFRQRQLETADRIDMRIGNVMHDLPKRPTARTIFRVELFIRQTFDRLRQFFGQIFNRLNIFFS